MAIHKLHKGGPGVGADATFKMAHFPQQLPPKKKSFMDVNAAKDGRNTRWMNFTGKPNSRFFEYADRDGMALQQYMRSNPIKEGDRIITHIVPMQTKTDYVDVQILSGADAAQASLVILDIDDLEGAPVLEIATGIDLSNAIDPLGSDEQQGHYFYDVRAANGDEPFVVRWNWVMALVLDALPEDDISTLHINVTPFMDYVHQVEH